MVTLGAGEEGKRQRAKGKDDGATSNSQLAIRNAINSGAAFAKFREFVAAQGGDVAMVDDPTKLPVAPVTVEVAAPQAGVIESMDAREIGLAVVALGGGRKAKGEVIDHRVGAVCLAKVGDKINAGEPLCIVHALDPASAEVARARIHAAYTLGTQAILAPPVVLDRIFSV